MKDKSSHKHKPSKRLPKDHDSTLKNISVEYCQSGLRKGKPTMTISAKAVQAYDTAVTASQHESLIDVMRRESPDFDYFFGDLQKWREYHSRNRNVERGSQTEDMIADFNDLKKLYKKFKSDITLAKKMLHANYNSQISAVANEVYAEIVKYLSRLENRHRISINEIRKDCEEQYKEAVTEISQQHDAFIEEFANKLNEDLEKELIPMQETMQRIGTDIKHQNDEIQILKFTNARFTLLLKKNNLIDPEGTISVDDEKAKTIEMVESYESEIQEKEENLAILKQKLKEITERYEAQLELQNIALPSPQTPSPSGAINNLNSTDNYTRSGATSLDVSRMGSIQNLNYVSRLKSRLGTSSTANTTTSNNRRNLRSSNVPQSHGQTSRFTRTPTTEFQSDAKDSEPEPKPIPVSETTFSETAIAELEQYYEDKMKFQRLMNDREMSELEHARERMKRVWELRINTLNSILHNDKYETDSMLKTQEKWFKFAAKYFPPEVKKRNVTVDDKEAFCAFEGNTLVDVRRKQEEKARLVWEYAQKMKSEGQSLGAALTNGFHITVKTSEEEQSDMRETPDSHNQGKGLFGMLICGRSITRLSNPDRESQFGMEPKKNKNVNVPLISNYFRPSDVNVPPPNSVPSSTTSTSNPKKSISIESTNSKFQPNSTNKSTVISDQNVSVSEKTFTSNPISIAPSNPDAVNYSLAQSISAIQYSKVPRVKRISLNSASSEKYAALQEKTMQQPKSTTTHFESDLSRQYLQGYATLYEYTLRFCSGNSSDLFVTNVFPSIESLCEVVDDASEGDQSVDSIENETKMKIIEPPITSDPLPPPTNVTPVRQNRPSEFNTPLTISSFSSTRKSGLNSSMSQKTRSLMLSGGRNRELKEPIYVKRLAQDEPESDDIEYYLNSPTPKRQREITLSLRDRIPPNSSTICAIQQRLSPIRSKNQSGLHTQYSDLSFDFADFDFDEDELIRVEEKLSKDSRDLVSISLPKPAAVSIIPTDMQSVKKKKSRSCPICKFSFVNFTENAIRSHMEEVCNTDFKLMNTYLMFVAQCAGD
ncbi:hypothetical protein HK098_005349 [Nowakowskiella sp. JEL0407]|nr:hypothetical protein HK098_005349 [Nowakowskiella sp. JEL0407]